MVKKVSSIIPAYNEGKRIASVLKILTTNHYINETIVINDGSTDNTAEIVKQFKNVILIDLKRNKGKSYAIMKGIEKSKGDFLVFIDSDLIGLTQKNITDLIRPVIHNQADVSISLRKNAPYIYRKIGLDFISGERVMKKSLLKDYRYLKNMDGFAIESAYLNKAIISNKARLKVVPWNNVESPYPSAKFGFFKGNIRLLKMILLLIKKIGLLGCISEIYEMRKLKV